MLKVIDTYKPEEFVGSSVTGRTYDTLCLMSANGSVVFHSAGGNRVSISRVQYLVIDSGSEVDKMRLKGVIPPDYRPDQGSKSKRGRRQHEDEAGTSFESPNYFEVLSDSASETENTESVTSTPKRKTRIPSIVLYSYLTHHSTTLKTLNVKLTAPVEVKTKLNRLLLYTKTEGYYNIRLQEIIKANLAYHTYPLPTEVQPRVALKGVPPTVEVEEI